jgi:hypothetical protein
MMFRYIEFAQRHKGLFNLMVGPTIIERGNYPELMEPPSSARTSAARLSASGEKSAGSSMVPPHGSRKR